MKNSPTLLLTLRIGLSYLGITGWPANLISGLIAMFLGPMIDKNVIRPIDITIDARNQAMKDPRWRDEATRLFSKASAKLYTEEEKDAIRQEYLNALGDYASLADRLRG